MSRLFCPNLLIAYSLVAFLALAAPDAHSEAEPVFDAASIVQPALLSAPGYRVEPQTQIHGYMARFVMHTDYGDVRADSVELLALRAAEMPALEALARAENSDAFGHAAAVSAGRAGSALTQVLKHPIDTLAGLPQGVARYFVRTMKSWTKRAQSLSDRGAREFGNDGDPYRAPDGPLSAARARLPDDPAPQKIDSSALGRVGAEAGREIKRQLDYRKVRRELARHLGVDPYTSNPLIVERLDALAWAGSGGKFAADSLLALTTGTTGRVLDSTAQLNKLVWELEPDDLKEANRQRIAAWCSDDFSLRQFLRRGGFSDSLRTSLADGLDALQPKSGCNDLIELATTTSSELEARYLVNALRLLQRHAAAGGDIHVVGAALSYRSPDAAWYLPLPLDWLSWNAQMAEFFDQSSLRHERKTALFSGDASLTAQRELSRRGWSLLLRAPYEGAPDFARFALHSQSRQRPDTACPAPITTVAQVDPYLDAPSDRSARCAVLAP